MRLIDADAIDFAFPLLDNLEGMLKQIGIEMVKIRVSLAPTIEAELVRHGRWVDFLCRDWRCSECGEKINKVRNVDGYYYDDKPNYCPNCGARMDGDSE